MENYISFHSSLIDDKAALLSAIIDSSEDAIVSKTLKGIITSWNPAARRLFGYTESEAIGRHISLIIPEERLPEEDFIISQVSIGNRIEHFETLRRRKDGSMVSLSLSVSPIRNEEGRIIGASKIARDISDRQKAAEKQSTLAAIVNTSDDTIVSKTLDGIITSWNPSAERMFGYTEAEAIGQHISLIIPKERLDEESYVIGEIRKGNKVDHFLTKRLTKDGRLVPISLSVSPITDVNGKVIGASKIARDISDQEALHEEKLQLYEQLKAANDRKDEFISLASHELKTPLTSVHAYLEILSRLNTNERATHILKKTQQQVKKLNALVSDLLDISKIQAGKLNYKMETFDMRTMVDNVIEMLSLSNPDYHITLTTVLEQCPVIGDADRIEQVLINLVTNAMRYSPGTDRVEVSLTQGAGMVTISVKDFGMGIAADKLDNVFKRFYRVENPLSNVSGLGIGLYLSREIIQRHHGKLWADSEPGKGSTFYFTLPLQQLP